MPGFDPADIEGTWNVGVLDVAAEHEDDTRNQRKTYHRRFRVPKAVDGEDITAEKKGSWSPPPGHPGCHAEGPGDRGPGLTRPGGIARRPLLRFTTRSANRLTVKPLKNRDPGSGMAVVDRAAPTDLGLSGGDFVRIECRDGATVARVWPSDRTDAGTGTVSIDGQPRSAAGVSVDDGVAVEAPASRRSVARPRRPQWATTSTAAETSRTSC
jgi:hypothetical protein